MMPEHIVDYAYDKNGNGFEYSIIMFNKLDKDSPYTNIIFVCSGEIGSSLPELIEKMTEKNELDKWTKDVFMPVLEMYRDYMKVKKIMDKSKQQ